MNNVKDKVKLPNFKFGLNQRSEFDFEYLGGKYYKRVQSYKAGDSLGENALLYDKWQRPVTVKTDTACEFAYLEREDYQPLIMQE